MKTLLSILLFAACCAAKDKPAAKPILSADQKVALLTAERDYLAAQKAAMPYDLAAKRAYDALVAQQATILKAAAIDPQKWNLDLMSLDFQAVDQPKPPDDGEKK